MTVLSPDRKQRELARVPFLGDALLTSSSTIDQGTLNQNGEAVQI